MYQLDLDMHLVFDPLMGDEGPGIVVSRRVEVPFAPHNGMRLYSSSWDVCWVDGPHGFELRDVVFDIDRQVFLAMARAEHSGYALAQIDCEVQWWLERGWKLGSHRDDYRRRAEKEYEAEMAAESNGASAPNPYDGVDIEMVQTLPPEQRPPQFNRLFKALIRHLANDYWDDYGRANAATAYAMDATNRYPAPAGLHKPEQEALRAWDEKRAEFEQISVEQREKWLRRVNRYPALSSLLKESSAPTAAATAKGATN
jgi:hypothetical protein